MRSNDAEKRGNDRREEISADDLLALLHKSVDQPKKPVDQKPVSKQISASAPRAAALKIDDSVYDDARRELLPENDDADVDIEELINKFIKTPAKKPEVDESKDIVREVSRPVDDDDVKVFKPPVKEAQKPETEPEEEPVAPDPEVQEEPVGQVSDDPDAWIESDVETPEDETQPGGTLDFEPTDDEELTDVTPAETGEFAAVGENEEIPEDSAGDIPDEPTPAGRTAVFDIARVKEVSDAPALPVESAATEVFDKISPESDPVAAKKSKIYGQPDADEIDQTDLNLMIAFGMNDELKDKVGEKKASDIEADLEKKSEETMQIQSIGSQYEYTDRAQNTEILMKFKSDYYWGIGRIALAVVMFVALFWIENCSLFGWQLPAFMRPESYPVVYAMVDLQFIVICGALVVRQVITGVKNMLTLKPTPESLTAFSLIVSIVYTIIACLIAPRAGFALYNLPTAAAVVLALIYEFMNLKRAVFGFNVVSSKRKKFVVSPVSDATETLEREIFSDYVPADSKIIRVTKTDFVDGFFAKVDGEQIPRPIIGILMPVVLVIAAAFFFLSYFRTQNVYTSLTMSFLTITATIPLTAFVIYSLPYYRASKRAYDADSAVIGDSAFSDFAGSAVISFEDKEVFPAGGVKVTSIKVYGNNRIDEIIYNLASAFIKVGGPLAEVFSQATHDLGHSENVEIESVEEDGFTVTIDDISVHLGKASYMERLDFEPPYDPEDKRIEAATIGILYVAYQGELAAKVYVQYTIDNEFEKILNQLYKTGMCVGIKSFDPNIDDMLLAKKLKAMKYPVKVIRSKTVEDIPHTSPRCDSGIVSKRSVKELLRTVASCERVSGAIRTSFIFKILAMLLGVVVMVFVLFFNAEPFVKSIYAVAYQLIWVALVTLVTRLSV